MITYKNPANDYKESFTKISYLWSFLFGWMYFAYKGSFSWAVISLVMAIFTGGISWFIMPIFTKQIVDKIYMQKGWVKV